MTDTLFFVYIVISIISYGIHGAFLVGYARSLDALIVTVYRGLSLGVIMMPVLFFATRAEILAITNYLPTLLIASGTGAFAFVCALNAARHLPVGIANSVRQAVSVVAVVVIGALFLQEYLSSIQLGLLGGIVACSIGLTLLRSDQSHLDSRKAWLGVGYCALAGVSAATTYYFFSILSRALNPFVASYFWELAIGLFTFAYVLVLIALGKYQSDLRMPMKQAIPIISISSLTIVATIAYAFAVNHGPFSLAAALLTTTVLIWTVMAWFLYNEKLKKSQLALIALSVLLIFLLRALS